MNKNIHLLISKKADSINKYVINTRRHFHMYPELSGKEKQTSNYVAEKLAALGLKVQTNIGGYGVVGILYGAKPGTTIAWRADMDACAIQEENDIPYKSQVDGVMHACGHDSHTAIALGIAETLYSIKDKLSGTIKFIFQPSEEGSDGALNMINDGVLENPRPSSIYGLHQGSLGANQSYMEAGSLSIIHRTVLFGYDIVKIHITVTRPKFNAWAEQELFISKLKNLNRCINKYGKRDLDNLVDLQIQNKEGNDETGEIFLKIRYRYSMQNYRNILREELSKIVDEYANHSNANVNIEYVKSIPPVYNDEKECEKAELILRELVGDNLIPIYEVPPHGSDDFAHFQNEISGLFFFLGSANLARGLKAANHTPIFDIDEDCLAFGVKTMSSFLFEILERTK